MSKYLFLDEYETEANIFDSNRILKPLFLNLSKNLFLSFKKHSFQNYTWRIFSVHWPQKFLWYVFGDCFYAGCMRKDFVSSERFWCQKDFLIESVSFKNGQIHVFHSGTICDLSIFMDSTKLLNAEIQYSTSAFDPFVIPNPSSKEYWPDHFWIIFSFFFQNFFQFCKI